MQSAVETQGIIPKPLLEHGDDHEGQLELLDFLLAYAAAPEFEHPGGIGWQETLPGRYHVRNSAGMQELAGMVVSWAWYTTNWVI